MSCFSDKIECIHTVFWVSQLLVVLGNSRSGNPLAGQRCNLCLSKYTNMLADMSVTSDMCLFINGRRAGPPQCPPPERKPVPEILATWRTR